MSLPERAESGAPSRSNSLRTFDEHRSHRSAPHIIYESGDPVLDEQTQEPSPSVWYGSEPRQGIRSSRLTRTRSVQTPSTDSPSTDLYYTSRHTRTRSLSRSRAPSSRRSPSFRSGRRSWSRSYSPPLVTPHTHDHIYEGPSRTRSFSRPRQPRVHVVGGGRRDATRHHHRTRRAPAPTSSARYFAPHYPPFATFAGSRTHSPRRAYLSSRRLGHRTHSRSRVRSPHRTLHTNYGRSRHAPAEPYVPNNPWTRTKASGKIGAGGPSHTYGGLDTIGRTEPIHYTEPIVQRRHHRSTSPGRRYSPGPSRHRHTLRHRRSRSSSPSHSPRAHRSRRSRTPPKSDSPPIPPGSPVYTIPSRSRSRGRSSRSPVERHPVIIPVSGRTPPSSRTPSPRPTAPSGRSGVPENYSLSSRARQSRRSSGSRSRHRRARSRRYSSPSPRGRSPTPRPLSPLSRVNSAPPVIPPRTKRKAKDSLDLYPPLPVTSGPEKTEASLFTLGMVARQKSKEISFYLLDTMPRDVYLYFHLRLPALYYSRVTRVFEDARLSMPDIKTMYQAESEGVMESSWDMVPQGHLGTSPTLRKFKSSWDTFIDSMTTEWQVQNVVSVLLLSAVLTMLQIEEVSNDPAARTAAIISLICALMSLLYGCMYMVQFSSMKKLYQAASWAEEAQNTKTAIFWNVWILLAMPVVWLSWSTIGFVICIMLYVWRTGSTADPPSLLDDTRSLGPRIAITAVFALGLVYLALIIQTLSRYASSMDQVWRRKIEEWRKEEANHSLPPRYSSRSPSYTYTYSRSPITRAYRESPSPTPRRHYYRGRRCTSSSPRSSRIRSRSRSIQPRGQSPVIIQVPGLNEHTRPPDQGELSTSRAPGPLDRPGPSLHATSPSLRHVYPVLNSYGNWLLYTHNVPRCFAPDPAQVEDVQELSDAEGWELKSDIKEFFPKLREKAPPRIARRDWLRFIEDLELVSQSLLPLKPEEYLGGLIDRVWKDVPPIFARSPQSPEDTDGQILAGRLEMVTEVWNSNLFRPCEFHAYIEAWGDLKLEGNTVLFRWSYMSKRDRFSMPNDSFFLSNLATVIDQDLSRYFVREPSTFLLPEDSSSVPGPFVAMLLRDQSLVPSAFYFPQAGLHPSALHPDITCVLFKVQKATGSLESGVYRELSLLDKSYPFTELSSVVEDIIRGAFKIPSFEASTLIGDDRFSLLLGDVIHAWNSAYYQLRGLELYLQEEATSFTVTIHRVRSQIIFRTPREVSCPCRLALDVSLHPLSTGSGEEINSAPNFGAALMHESRNATLLCFRLEDLVELIEIPASPWHSLSAAIWDQFFYELRASYLHAWPGQAGQEGELPIGCNQAVEKVLRAWNSETFGPLYLHCSLVRYTVSSPLYKSTALEPDKYGIILQLLDHPTSPEFGSPTRATNPIQEEEGKIALGPYLEYLRRHPIAIPSMLCFTTGKDTAKPSPDSSTISKRYQRILSFEVSKQTPLSPAAQVHIALSPLMIPSAAWKQLVHTLAGIISGEGCAPEPDLQKRSESRQSMIADAIEVWNHFFFSQNDMKLELESAKQHRIEAHPGPPDRDQELDTSFHVALHFDTRLPCYPRSAEPMWFGS